MKLITDLRQRRFGDLEVGELIVPRFGGTGALALVLDKGVKDVTIGLLRSDRTGRPTPFYTTLAPSGDCLTLGQAFAFEIGAEDSVIGANRRYEPGAISIGLDGEIVLAFAPFDSFSHNEIGFDLQKLEIAEIPGGSSVTTIASWRIWRNEVDRIRPGANPILAFQLLT